MRAATKIDAFPNRFFPSPGMPCPRRFIACSANAPSRAARVFPRFFFVRFSSSSLSARVSVHENTAIASFAVTNAREVESEAESAGASASARRVSAARNVFIDLISSAVTCTSCCVSRANFRSYAIPASDLATAHPDASLGSSSSLSSGNGASPISGASLRVVPYKRMSGWSSKASVGVEWRRGRGLKARGGRRDTPGNVLKDRRSPRQRGRMGTSV
eukprot:31180-Pelagococcus_subviridis.AAC.12